VRAERTFSIANRRFQSYFDEDRRGTIIEGDDEIDIFLKLPGEIRIDVP